MANDRKIKIQLKKPQSDDKLKITSESSDSNDSVFVNRIMVDYQGKSYLVLLLKTEYNQQMINMPTIIDLDDYTKIKDIRWHRTGKYISHSTMTNRVIKVTFLHHMIMNHNFDDKLRIDHINRICQDNRKENLRVANQTEQNYNQKKRVRRLTSLPENCNVDPDDIPTNVEFHPAYGPFGDYFEVVIKINGERVFRKKTTKSKKFTIEQKLIEAKIILQDAMKVHPEWFNNRCLNGSLTDEGNRLYESYFTILKLAKVEDPSNHYIEPSNRRIDPLNIGDGASSSSKHVINLPHPETGITKLPKYCRYIPASTTRGDYFEYIHKSETDQITHHSSTSRRTTTIDKFNELMKILTQKNLLEWGRF